MHKAAQAFCNGAINSGLHFESEQEYVVQFFSILKHGTPKPWEYTNFTFWDCTPECFTAQLLHCEWHSFQCWSTLSLGVKPNLGLHCWAAKRREVSHWCHVWQHLQSLCLFLFCYSDDLSKVTQLLYEIRYTNVGMAQGPDDETHRDISSLLVDIRFVCGHQVSQKDQHRWWHVGEFWLRAF